MLEAMTIIFGFMVFMVILTKGHLLFINITSHSSSGKQNL